MTDTIATEVPTEPVQPIPEAAAPSAPAPDIEPDETPDTRTARERILDHFVDCEGDQNVAQIMAGTGLDRGLVDSTLTRAVQRGLIERVSQGVYRLAPPPPPKSPRPEQPPQVIDGRSVDEWMALLERWSSGGEWQGPGPPPDTIGNMVPREIHMRFKQRIEMRKAKEAADDALLEKLLVAANGNYGRDGRLLDLRPIHVILNSGVRLEDIIGVITNEVDPRTYPKNRTIATWDAPWFLRSVAEQHCRFRLAPRWAARWQARLARASVAKDAKDALQEPVDASKASAAVPSTRRAGDRTGGLPAAAC
jgi:hypothetical protein